MKIKSVAIWESLTKSISSSPLHPIISMTWILVVESYNALHTGSLCPYLQGGLHRLFATSSLYSTRLHNGWCMAANETQALSSMTIVLMISHQSLIPPLVISPPPTMAHYPQPPPQTICDSMIAVITLMKSTAFWINNQLSIYMIYMKLLLNYIIDKN